MTTRARVSAHLVGLVLIVAAFVLLQGHAEASCALPPQPSANSFTGTVVSVSDDGRVAKVRTAEGIVTVRGKPDGAAASSVDRRYAVGAGYEFHPINSQSPFEDNACTATTQLSGPAPTRTRSHKDVLPGWLPVDEDAGLLGYSVLVALLAAPLALIATVTLARRSARRRPASA